VVLSLSVILAETDAAKVALPDEEFFIAAPFKPAFL
jgi:hypothetical protein